MLWKIKDEAHFNLSPTDGVMYKAIEKARENAKLRNSKAQFYVMDAKRLEFDDESFDLVVTLGYNLPHFSIYDFDEIVREAYRVLKPDGAIILDYSKV